MYEFRTIEKEIGEKWEKEKTYEKCKKANKEGEPFYFCDGPPYATGQIHPGTAWNKAIKDSVCRYWRMMGRDVRVQPGFDTHGLPIEVKVEQEIGIKNKNEIEKYGIGKFIDRCKEFATRYMGVMGGQFRSVGVWMDWDNPYITYKDEFINSSWKTLKMAHESGLMHEGIYVLPYCYRCETTMANYELEYGEESDPSIYVKFKVKPEGKKAADNEYLIIWTTTPWTLVSNMAVMVHPTLQYVKANIDGEVWIVAKERLEHLLNLLGKSGTVLEELSGKKLEDTEYEHPFQDKIAKVAERKVVLSDEYVTLEDGSGLVHCAPGHGPEDFIIGKRFGIEAFSPVDEHGKYTSEAGVYEGKNVREANPAIIEELDMRGSLLHKARVKHRYPHCWRCKTPLIFRTTKQWFITVSKTKDKMLSEIKNVKWYPSFVEDRFTEFVTGAPDWCISRQRYWGIPLPIWKCNDEKCSKVKVIGSRDELPQKVKELHRPYMDEVQFDCECGNRMKRIPDVLDVWFDSGNAIWASLSPEDAKHYGERADLIIEGQDQIRGWFYSLLGSGVVRYNASPYKRLLMHGFFVDEKGEKMSKSVGNFVPLEDILAKYGADSFRLWGLSGTIWEELRFNWTELKEASADLNIVFNLFVFLDRFYPKKKITEAKLDMEDQWLISRTNSTLKEYHESFQNYEINKAVKCVRRFIVEDISRWYMKVAKNRISGEENAEGAHYAVYYAVLAALRMLMPVAPFLAESVYTKFFDKFEKKGSLALERIGEAEEARIDLLLEKQMAIAKEVCSVALTARQDAKVKVRWPLRTLSVGAKSHEFGDAVNAMAPLIARVVNVKEIKTVSDKPKGEKIFEKELPEAKLYLDAEIDEALYEEAIVNEVKRRVQMLRKEGELVEKDEITVYFSGEDEMTAIVKKNAKAICDGVNAKDVEFSAHKKATEYDIDGKVVKIAIEKRKK
jgi:isoleucyl-tRNA synthetase